MVPNKNHQPAARHDKRHSGLCLPDQSLYLQFAAHNEYANAQVLRWDCMN